MSLGLRERTECEIYVVGPATCRRTGRIAYTDERVTIGGKPRRIALCERCATRNEPRLDRAGWKRSS